MRRTKQVEFNAKELKLLEKQMLDPMRRRAFLSMAGAALVLALSAQRGVAQTGTAPRLVAFLRVATEAATGAREMDALREALRQHGHVEGRDIVIVHRSAQGRLDALPALAAELAALKPSVIIAGGTVAARALRTAAPDLPMVALVGELTAAGLAMELGRPGGGVTGVSFLSANLDSKRLELLAELLPKGSAVMNLADASTRSSGDPRALEAAASALGLVSHTLQARTTAEIEAAFAEARKLRVAGINVLTSPFLNFNRGRIIALAASARLPAIYQWPETAEEGGLMAYGPRVTELYRQLASFVSRILNGARPADLPIEQPTKFELVINLKTAKALDLTIPPSLRVRADKLIE